MKTVAYALVEDVFLVVQGAAAANPEETDAGTSIARANAGKIRAFISVTSGPAPRSKRREDFRKLWSELNQPRCAILSHSQLVRSSVSLMGWFLKDSIKAFLPEHLPEAFAYLDIGARQAEKIRATLDHLCAEVGASYLRVTGTSGERPS